MSITNKTYIPNLGDYACVSLTGSGYVRAYKTMPQRNSCSNFDTIYLNNHYMTIYNDCQGTNCPGGGQCWTSNSTLPVCISTSQLTDEVYYRNDFADILIIFVLLSFICFWVPWRLFSRMFRRWR